VTLVQSYSGVTPSIVFGDSALESNLESHLIDVGLLLSLIVRMDTVTKSN